MIMFGSKFARPCPGPCLYFPCSFLASRCPSRSCFQKTSAPSSTKNAMPLRHESFDDDTENILAAILGKGRRERNWEKSTSALSIVLHVIGGVVGPGLTLVTVALFHFWIFDRSLSESVGTPMTVLIIVCSVILGLWIGLRRARRAIAFSGGAM
jgi:hypothetical protein